MKNNIWTVYKIELEKLIKRKDFLALLALIAVNLYFGITTLSSVYTGVSNQSAIYWLCTQIFNSSTLLINAMIFAFIGSKTLATEVESGSILLYTIRIKDRKSIYIGKSLALLTFVTLSFIFICLFNIIIYYIMVTNNANVASNSFLGNNTMYIVITIIMIYFSSFILVSQFALSLGSFLKSSQVIGITFIITLLCHNALKVPIIIYFNPWYYIKEFSKETIYVTEKVVINFSDKGLLVLHFSILCCVSLLLFNIFAINKLEKKEI